jgi:hypothetical protein
MARPVLSARNKGGFGYAQQHDRPTRAPGECLKTLRSPFDKLRANRVGVEIIEDFPFCCTNEDQTLRSSKGLGTPWPPCCRMWV